VADNITDTIDSLQYNQEISEPLRSRVRAGIKDAETKNEGLWKLYVFISDGLFYTGLLAKLMDNHQCAMNPANHEKHLEVAQDIVVRAIRSAWRYWRASKKGAIINILERAPVGELAGLLKTLVGEGEVFRRGEKTITKEVSAVSVRQYLHGKDDKLLRCRDVRYKFDLGIRGEDAVERIPAGEHREAMREILGALNLSQRVMDYEEATELVDRLADASTPLQDLVRSEAARGATSIDEDKLRELWLSDLK